MVKVLMAQYCTREDVSHDVKEEMPLSGPCQYLLTNSSAHRHGGADGCAQTKTPFLLISDCAVADGPKSSQPAKPSHEVVWIGMSSIPSTARDMIVGRLAELEEV